MDDKDVSPIRSALLEELDQEWANVERVCASLTQEQMVTAGAQGKWSVKDILVHISAWEKYLLDRLGYVLTGHHPQYPRMTSWDDVHRFNAQVYAENRDRPLPSVIIEFRTIYQGVMTVLSALNDEQLNQPYTYDFPDDSLILVQLIRANTFEHYREHCIEVEKK